MAVPRKDASLAQYSTNFNTRGWIAPEEFGLTELQMAQFTVLHEAWMSAYHAAAARGARSAALVTAKNDAKKALLTYARELYGFIQANNAVSDENKALMGVRIPGDPTLKLPPKLAPTVAVLSVTGYVAKYQLGDAEIANSRHKPVTADGAVVLSFVGENPPPANETGWKLEKQTGRRTFDVTFPNTTAPGTSCWVIARWYSRKGDFSPACAPVRTYLQVGPMREAA